MHVHVRVHVHVHAHVHLHVHVHVHVHGICTTHAPRRACSMLRRRGILAISQQKRSGSTSSDGSICSARSARASVSGGRFSSSDSSKSVVSTLVSVGLGAGLGED